MKNNLHRNVNINDDLFQKRFLIKTKKTTLVCSSLFETTSLYHTVEHHHIIQIFKLRN